MIAAAVALSLAAGLGAEDPPDRQSEPLSPWKEGWMDIHHLAYGRGNSTFAVLPDGTTLLIDAGAVEGGIEFTDPLPDDSRSPSAWIIAYLKRALRDLPARIDYAVLTHFHADHMGQITASSPSSTRGDYLLSGITAVGDEIPIAHMLDRAWPDYNYPIPLDFSFIRNYRKFLDTQQASGLEVARFQPGSADQIRLRREAAKYPGFEVRNLAANGGVWTGVGESTRQQFPPLSDLAQDDYPTENMCSIALRISYGAFDYFTAGDLPGVSDAGFPEWGLVELPIARVLGPTEVYAVNHHGSLDPASPELLETLRPRVDIIPSWAPTHPAPSVLKRLLSTRYYPGPRDVFATVIRDPTGPATGSRINEIMSKAGHIVVRVEPGGGRYWVVIASPLSDPGYPVTAVHGPYLAD